MNKIFSILYTFLQIAQISAQDAGPDYIPKNEIIKKITQVILQSDKEYPYFFEYDSIVFLNGISKSDITKMNNYLRSDFSVFVNTNKDAQITYNAHKNFTDYTNGSDLYMQYSTHVTDYTSTYININKAKFWCCRHNGLNGYHPEPPQTIAIKTLKPINLDAIFIDGFKEILIDRIRKHPDLKELEEDGKVIKQYICEDDKKDYLIQKVKNATNTQEIKITASGIYVVTQEVAYCSETEKYGHNKLEVGANFSEIKEFIKPDNSYIFE